jgi:hypothetical protein
MPSVICHVKFNELECLAFRTAHVPRVGELLTLGDIPYIGVVLKVHWYVAAGRLWSVDILVRRAYPDEVF